MYSTNATNNKTCCWFGSTLDLSCIHNQDNYRIISIINLPILNKVEKIDNIISQCNTL